MKTVVIPRSAMPARTPLWVLCVLGLMLDRFGAPEWAMGAFFMLSFIITVIFIIARHKEVEKPLPGYGDGVERDTSRKGY